MLKMGVNLALMSVCVLLGMWSLSMLLPIKKKWWAKVIGIGVCYLVVGFYLRSAFAYGVWNVMAVMLAEALAGVGCGVFHGASIPGGEWYGR